MKLLLKLNGVKALLLFQTVLMVSLAIVCYFINGEKAGYSAILAGFSCLLSTAVFASIVFKRTGAQAAKQIARSFYRAEAIKWIITIALMTFIFVFIPVAAGSFFATFCIMQLSYWIAPILFSD